MPPGYVLAPDPSGRDAPAGSPTRMPTALALGGLDPSGGAGLAADLRAFAATGVWGAAVCTALTVQSTRGVRSMRPVAAALVDAQAREVLDDLDVRAIKTGALASAANARVVARLARAYPNAPLVVDPVMLPTRSLGGSSRLDGGAGAELLALARAAALVTPNWAEAAMLSGRRVRSDAEARDAARALVDAGCGAVLVKGGHGRGREAIDWFAWRAGDEAIRGPRHAATDVHGTGCTLASLVAGNLAAPRLHELDPPAILEAIRAARTLLDRALEAPARVGGGQRVLHVFARTRSR